MRIPFSHTPPEPGTSLPHAELILKPGDTPTMLSKKTESANTSDIPMEIAMPKEPENTNLPVPAEENVIRCLCPVCQSELKVSAIPTAPFGSPSVAEVVHSAKQEPAAVSSDAHGDSPAPAGSEESPAIQRERQIAAAREAHQVSLYPAMKPRLSYVLTGERPGPPEPAPAHPTQSDPDSNNGSGIKTLNE